ncbi:hypothetical protein GGI20_003976 [Coemansia sp. BCRC 34301]|nr:hypothetical protein GGI20_003976 [Coemansia sp. BCRC 34301]
MLADFVDGLNYVHGDASMSPWEASEILAGWGLSNKYEELGAGTISPFSMLLSTEDIEEVLRLASINSGTGTGDLESAKDAPITHTNFVGVHPETAMHRDAYWFDQCPGATYEGYVLESVYHLNYYHGVSSLTGRPFPEPQATRVVIAGSGKQRRQGQCHICLEWVNTESTRKARVNVPEIYWWKHIQACIKRTWDE